MMRGSLIPLIYEKTLHVDSTSPSRSSPSGTLTLVTTDIATISGGIFLFHETWSNLIEMGIAIYLLERQLGAACVMGVGFAISTFPLYLVIFAQTYIPLLTKWFN